MSIFLVVHIAQSDDQSLLSVPSSSTSQNRPHHGRLDHSDGRARLSIDDRRDDPINETRLGLGTEDGLALGQNDRHSEAILESEN